MIENRGPELQVVCATFVSVAFVAVVLRVYVRLRIVKKFGWDDTWMVAAMLTHIMFVIGAIYGVHYGTGRHHKDLTEGDIRNAMRFWWLCYTAYCLTMIAAKFSIGIFLLRITIHQPQCRIIYAVLVLTVITGVMFLFIMIFQCTPISFYWNKSQTGSCLNRDVIVALTYVYSLVSAVCDFTFGLMPVWLVWGLNMRRSEKLVLTPILGIGCVASTAVVVRMAFLEDFRSADFLYDTIDIAIWSDIEQGLAITAASLATLRPLYRVLVAYFRWSESSTIPLNESKKIPYPSSGFSNSQKKKKRNGQFSLISYTRNDGADEEEYRLESCRPVKLRDDLVEDVDEQGRPRSEKGFASWRIQTGGGNEEELSSVGGITRQTEVHLSSEVDRQRKVTILIKS